MIPLHSAIQEQTPHVPGHKTIWPGHPFNWTEEWLSQTSMALIPHSQSHALDCSSSYCTDLGALLKNGHAMPPTPAPYPMELSASAKTINGARGHFPPHPPQLVPLIWISIETEFKKIS